MRRRYKSAYCPAASASSPIAKLRSLFSMISSCLSVTGAVATRYKESINESIVFMPSVRSNTHHKMRVRLKFEIGSSTARESSARLARSCEAGARYYTSLIFFVILCLKSHNSAVCDEGLGRSTETSLVAHSSPGDFHLLSICVAVLLWPANSQHCRGGSTAVSQLRGQ